MRFLQGIWHLVILGPTQESFSNMLKPRQVLLLSTYAGASNDTIPAHPEAAGGGRELELPTFQPHKIHWLVEKPDTASPGCLDVPPSKTGAAV